MNKLFLRGAFAAGLAAIGWVAAGYLRTNPLALAMTGAIATFYLAGALELHRFDAATAGLARALAALPGPVPDLGAWLATLPEGLRQPVRLRVEGGRIALPGPAMAPYLAGLLVLLGMLGTFLGMVVTLSGTGLALERATDLPTMRDSLAAPVRGLGLAFGTSVAGVAASAMLGLMTALARRARLQAVQRLDAHIATTLRPFGRAHQREQAWQLQQQQAQLLPALVAQLQALATQMHTQGQQAQEQRLAREQALHDQLLARQQSLHERLFAQVHQTHELLQAGQARFHGQAEAGYLALARSVDQTLQHSLAESARIAAATLQPAVEATMSGITRETAALHGRIAATVQQQLDGLAAQFAGATQAVAGTWTAALAQHERTSERLAQGLGAQLEAFGQRFDERSGAWLARTGAQIEQQATALVGRFGQAQAAQQAQLGQTLAQAAGRIAEQAEAQARSTIGEVSRLVQVATEAPRAAAEVVAQLREKLSESLARDNALLDERARIMATLDTLLGAVQRATTEQTRAIDQLAAGAAGTLAQAGERLGAAAQAQAVQMETASAQLAASAVEVASLGEAFGTAVAQFGQASGQLATHLQRVDETLARAVARSDEQLAYYVAQAREVIDLTLASQKQLVDDLQRLAGERRAAEARAA